MREVRIIQPITAQAADKLRVAAYARVSSDSADQRNSFAAQVKYYTQFIQAHADWQFVDIYADAAVIIGLKTLRLKKSQKHAAF